MKYVTASDRNLRIKFSNFEVDDWGFALEADGQSYTLADARLEVSNPDPLSFVLDFSHVGLRWSFRCSEIAGQNRLIVESKLENKGENSLHLGMVDVFCATPRTPLGTPDSSTVHLGLEGVGFERHVIPIENENSLRNCTVKSQFHSKTLALAVQIGFITLQKLDTRVAHNYSPEAGITDIRAYCDFEGWELKPAHSVNLETFTLAVGADPFKQLEDWADLVAERSNPRKWQDVPIGYAGGAWVDKANYENHEDAALRNGEAIQRKLAGFGLDYIWVSIANLKGGFPGDWLSWNAKNFPSGREAFIKKMKEYGLTVGFWCAPFWICSNLTDLVDEFKDAFLKDLDGNILVARGEWQYGDSGRMPREKRPACLALDPTHPKVLELLKKVFRTYREWGIRYYMADFLECATGKIGRLPNSGVGDKDVLPGQEAYHNALQVIREAAGDDTYILASTGPTVHNLGFADAIRTGNDFGEGRALNPDSFFYPGSYVINNAGFWTGAKAALQNQASSYYTHRKLYINDSGNVLTVDKPLPTTDAQIHATIHAMSGGPSMIGDDIDRMDDERLGFIKKTLPRSKDVAFPVDLFDSLFPDYPRVYHRKVVKPWGRFDVVAVYNFEDTIYEGSIDLQKLDLDPAKNYLVWEFWDSRYVGPTSGKLKAVVPPGSVKVYRLTADEGVPTVVGSDMHLCMGEMELQDSQYDAEKMSLSITAVRPPAEVGSLFIYIPEGYAVKNPKGYWVAKDGRYDNLIVRAKLSFPDGIAKLHIDIEPVKTSQDLREIEP